VIVVSSHEAVCSFIGRFGNFFNHVDNFANEAFLYVTSGGIPATRSAGNKSLLKDKSIDEALGSEIDEGEIRHGDGDEG
jgi:tRNA pseudouridine38-40 synthase